MKPFFGMLFPLLLSVTLFLAAPPPTAQATNDVPEGLTPAEWAQIQNQLDPDPTPTWTELVKLYGSDSGPYKRFGSSVAVDGDTAVIGEPHGGDGENGSAYVFTRTSGVWGLQAKLTDGDPTTSDYFGVSVAISGDTVVIGAQGDELAYVFTRTAGVWSQQAKLADGDPTTSGYFGGSVAISGDTVLISTRGAAYVFTRTAGVWSQQAKLTDGDPTTSDYFGGSVAISGDTAVIGTVQAEILWNDDENTASGSAYVFTRTGGVWSQQAQLTASDSAEGDGFSYSVAVHGDTAVIGAPLAVNEGIDSGSAYVFTRAGGVWSQQTKLTAGDSAAGVWFGLSVALSGNTILIGTFNDDVDSESVYVFTRMGGVWNQQAKLTSKEYGHYGDGFGWSVALSDDTAFIGAPRDTPGWSMGAAYTFTFNSSLLQKIYQWFIIQAGY